MRTVVERAAASAVICRKRHGGARRERAVQVDVVVRALDLVEDLRRKRLRVAAAGTAREAAVEVRPLGGEVRTVRLERRRVADRDELDASFYIGRRELAEKPDRGENTAVLAAVDARRYDGSGPCESPETTATGRSIVRPSSMSKCRISVFCRP